MSTNDKRRHYTELISPSRPDPAGLEALYRRAAAAGDENEFRAALAERLAESSDPTLVAWGYRLDLVSGATPAADTGERERGRNWALAAAFSIALGIVWTLLVGDGPPAPIPGEASPWFWLGWPAATALAILGYVSLSVDRRDQWQRSAPAAIAVVGISAAAGWAVWGETGDAAILVALHLPLVAWAAVGFAWIGNPLRRPGEAFAYVVKSAEVVLIAGVFAGAAGAFGALTFGIFSVLGVQIPEALIQRAGSFALGAIPVMAVAAACDPRAELERALLTGPLGLLRLVARLFVIPVLLVLVAYVGWFIPHYFWQPFGQRDVLIVYNATILAVAMLLTIAVPHVREHLSEVLRSRLRWALVAIGTLGGLLNLYALSAVLSRAWHDGLTLNRQAVIGWNLVTLLLLVAVVWSLVRTSERPWPERFAGALVGVLPVAAAWCLWVVAAAGMQAGFGPT